MLFVLVVMPRLLDRYPDYPDAERPARFPENEVGHACRRDAIVDGVCIDCERPPAAYLSGSSEQGHR